MDNPELETAWDSLAIAYDDLTRLYKQWEEKQI